MPRQRTSVRARRKKLFTRTSSTFINNTPKPNSSILGLGKLLHSKSTYFYRWGSRKVGSDGRSGSSAYDSLASLQRHPVDLPKSSLLGRDSGPVQPGNDVLWRNCRQKNLSKLSSLSYVTPTVCTLALLVGGVVAINPLVNGAQVAFAQEVAPRAGMPTIGLQITPNVSDSTNRAVQAGVVAYFSNNITVSGSNVAQYSLILNSGADSTGELVGQNNPYAVVNKVSAGTAVGSFADNTWGYAVSSNASVDKASLSYNPVPGGEEVRTALLAFKKVSGGWTGSDNYKLVFAAKLGSNMPADHYQIDMYLSAVASATETVENWFRDTARITTMQEMSSNICKTAPEHATSQLRDIRDNKLYWVTKLKDGNCWMTQNLDFDGGGIPVVGDFAEWKASVDISTTPYYDPGPYYYNGPSGQHGHWGNTVSSSTNLSAVGGMFSKVGNDEHYLIGNYYSWPATRNDICPAGWRMPSGGSNGEFKRLMSAYGWVNGTNSAINMNPDAAGSNRGVYGEPLYFVYGGMLSANSTGQLNNAGYQVDYWSATQYNSSQAYTLYLTAEVAPETVYKSYKYGMSVRCVAK